MAGSNAKAQEEESNMKSKLLRIFPIILFAGVFFMGAMPAQAAKLRVVATLTDLADFTRNLGGDLVEVKSLATGVEDTHGVPMKPSFVPLLNRADLVILIGLDCEHAFLPALLEASKNPRIQVNKSGYVDCSKGIIPLDVPKSTDHSDGDVLAEGNPHYTLDPVLSKVAINNIYKALVAAAPEHKTEFTRNRDAYLAKLNAKITEWEKATRPLKGTRFVSYHEHWPYFAERFGMKYYGTIELKPGVDPTPRHIQDLVSAMKADHVPLVVREPQFPEKAPKRVAEMAGATLVTLPIMPGGAPNTETYIKMMDLIVHTMVNAMQTRK
jgi:ABC-type Zn uptake system ZnuABC Zn-binding protein ZnuA